MYTISVSSVKTVRPILFPVIRLEGIVEAILGRPVNHDLRFHMLGDVSCAPGQVDRFLPQLRIGIAELAELPARINPEMGAELYNFQAQVIGQRF